MMTLGLFFISLALFNLVLGDDYIGGAVLGAGEATVDFGETVLNGLRQLPQASFEAGEAVGEAAVDWFDSTQGATADSDAVPPATDGSVNDAENLRKNPGAAPGAAGLAVPASAPTQPQKAGSNDDPVIKINISGEPESPKTAPHDDCDSESLKGSQDSDSCRVATARMIWPSDRGNSAQNANIQTALVERMKNPHDVVVSEDDQGIFFWSAPLTDEQAGDLKATVEGISDIVNDEAVFMNDSPTAAKRVQKRMEKAVIQDKRIQKRVEKVVIQDKAPPHLEYISTPPSDSDTNPSYGYTSPDPPSIRNPPDFDASRFAYLENAGEGIRGYWIDYYGPENPDDTEYTTHNIIRGNIRALQPAGLEWNGEDYGKPGHMLGAISLIAGLQFGVAKKASLILTQVVPYTSSFLDALIKIKADLRRERFSSHEVRGYTVVGTGIRADEQIHISIRLEARELIQELINEFQVVFIAAAGNSETVPYSQIDSWPAIWASEDLPIIVAGGVDLETGKSNPSSLTGPAMTVSAPYWTFNKKGSLGIFYSSGTCDSAALTTGLVMSYLSSSAVRDVLNLAENALPNPSRSVAEKIRAYTVQMAYARPPGGVRVIWNGLSSTVPNYHRVGAGFKF